jgi:hypothetical protein
MDDTNMNQKTTQDMYDENIKAFDELYGDLSPHNGTKSNESSGGPTEDPDCTIDDAQKAQFQAKHGDEMYYEPFTPKPPRGSVEGIQHRLRITGLRLRRELNHSLLTNPDQWDLYPTLRVMQHLHSHKGQYDYIPGGVESMVVYSYFHQGGRIPQNRTERDLRVLRNTVFPAGSDLPDQLRVNAEVTEGISTHLRSTLRRLKEITVLPSIDRVGDIHDC